MAWIKQEDNLQGAWDWISKIGIVAGAGAATFFTGGAAAPLLATAIGYALAPGAPQTGPTRPVTYQMPSAQTMPIISQPKKTNWLLIGGLGAAGIVAVMLITKKKSKKRRS